MPTLCLRLETLWRISRLPHVPQSRYRYKKYGDEAMTWALGWSVACEALMLGRNSQCDTEKGRNKGFYNSRVETMSGDMSLYHSLS
jgi:hypothetical protein